MFASYVLHATIYPIMKLFYRGVLQYRYYYGDIEDRREKKLQSRGEIQSATFIGLRSLLILKHALYDDHRQIHYLIHRFGEDDKTLLSHTNRELTRVR